MNEPKHEAFWLRLSRVTAILPMDTSTQLHQLISDLTRQFLIIVIKKGTADFFSKMQF